MAGTRTVATLKPVKPGLAQYALVEGYTPGAATNILASNFTPAAVCAKVEVSVVLGTGSVFNVVRVGTNTTTAALNDGTALTADREYTFTIAACKAVPINFQVATDGRIESLIIRELAGQ